MTQANCVTAYMNYNLKEKNKLYKFFETKTFLIYKL